MHKRTTHLMPSTHSGVVEYEEFHLSEADLITLAKQSFADIYDIPTGKVRIHEGTRTGCPVVVRINTRDILPKKEK